MLSRANDRRSAICLLLALLSACGGDKDALRTVRSYDFSSCDSSETSDRLELEGAARFDILLTQKYFVRDGDLLTAANHESSVAASGLRQYQGPFYTYVHPRMPSDEERAQDIDWVGLIFLHAKSVRTRINGGGWGEWQRVRTRNFSDQTQGVDHLGRWKCLVNAEIAWAELTHRSGVWMVQPSTVSVYEAPELARLLPLATVEQVSGDKPVEAGAIQAAVSANR
jgi:hypothetical protein